jgi:hypothetical protein
MSINPGHPLEGNETGKPAVIMGMSGCRQGKRFLRRICDEEFFACNANALTTVRSVNLGCMSLKPSPVTRKTRVLRSRLRQRHRIANFFHDNLRLLNRHTA